MSQDSAPTTANTASNLIVNYIPKEFNDEMLNKLFAPFGEIESARIIRDKVTSETKGFGFVKFCNGESASKAICALQGFEILGKRLKISYSHHNKAPIPLNMMEVLSQQQQQQYNRMMTSPHTSSRPNSPQQQTISPVQQPIQPQIIFVVQQPPSPQINYPLSISPVALSEADISVQDSTLPPLSPAHAATSPTLSPTQQVSFAALTQQMLQMNHLQQQQQLLMQQQQQQAQLAALDSMMFPFGPFFPLQQMNMMA